MLACKNCFRIILRAVQRENSVSPYGNACLRLSPALLTISRPRSQRQLLSTSTQTAPLPARVEDGLSPRGRETAIVARRNLEKELAYLEDSVKLADYTLRLLRQNNLDKALGLIQLASNRQDCTVSWNHIINHCVQGGHLERAFKIFNDMKKRAQRPDAYTYTLLLRGFSKHPNVKNFETALRIYYSMSGDNANIKPSVIHTNTMLMVCAKNGALDEMFTIAARLPDRGPGSADTLTYTTILNAIRMEAWKPNSSETEESRMERRQQAVFHGRRIWQDVAQKWMRGQMTVDEELVCAMGRLLLVGNQESDIDDVLSLVEQTMRIPRQLYRLGHPQRGTHLRASSGEDSEDPFNPSADDIDLPEASLERKSRQTPASKGQVEAATQPLQLQRPEFIARPLELGSIIYPKPGRNTLSMVIDSCTRMRAFKPAQQYWEIIIASVDPDLENYHMYLRLLRASRASALAVGLVQDLCKGVKAGGLGAKVQQKTFRITMSACVRDGNNPAAIRHGTRVLTLMQMNLEEPDVETVTWFTGLLKKHQVLLKGQPRDPQKMQQRVKDILAALDAMFCVFVNMRSLYAFGRTSQNQNILPETEYEAMLDNLEPADLSWVKRRDPSSEEEAKRWKQMEGRSSITQEERQQLRSLGRLIEAEFTRALQTYHGIVSQPEWQKLVVDRARIRGWYLKRSHPQLVKKTKGATASASRASGKDN